MKLPILPGGEARDRNKLSWAQRRIWSLWERDRDSAVCNVSAAAPLIGRLNVSALHRAFDSVIGRHEILRTAFNYEPGAGPEMVPALRPSRVVHTDMRALPKAQREQCVEALTEHHARQPFDLANGPLLRVSLLKLTDEERVLLICMHRLIADEASLQVFIDEFIHYYCADDGGEAPPLAELSIQYGDYALWQRRRLELGGGRRKLEYWRATLGERHPFLELPADRPRPATASFRCASHRFAIEPMLAEDLRTLVRRQRLTLFIVLLGTFAMLLCHPSGQTDIRIGVPVANRHCVETKSLIGCLADLLVMRVRVDARLRVDEFLSGLEQTLAAAQAHGGVPLAQLVEVLQPSRFLSHDSILQVTYSHDTQMAGSGPRRIGRELTLGPLDFSLGFTEFELSLNTCEQGGRLHAVLTYATDRFDASTIERLTEHWRILLEGIAADPTQRIGTLPMPGETQRRYAQARRC